MIWHSRKAKFGDIRVRRRFAWWPTRIDDDTVAWWQTYWEAQEHRGTYSTYWWWTERSLVELEVYSVKLHPKSRMSMDKVREVEA